MIHRPEISAKGFGFDFECNKSHFRVLRGELALSDLQLQNIILSAVLRDGSKG